MVKIGPAFSDYITSEKGSRRRSHNRLFGSDFLSIVPLFILILVFSVLLLRLLNLQVLKSDYYKKLSDRNRTKTKIIPAPRGIIFDRNNKPLVRNTPAFRITDNKEIKWVEKNDALSMISSGKDVVSDVQRQYLYKDAFAHVLGYIGQISEKEILLPDFKDHSISDLIGKTGLEKQYDELLYGKNGKELYEVDAKGKTIRFLGKEEEVSGKNINTTLDLNLQLATHKAFENVKKGAAIVSNPMDGSILVLYSKPNFDPNLFTYINNYKGSGQYENIEDVLLDSENQPILNRAVSGTYPPGSTFKLITATAALEKGTINKSTQIEDTGILRVGDFSFGNWYFSSYGRTEGWMDIISAIKRSNDIFFYKVAEKTGVDIIHDWSNKFGLGKVLNIDLPGESKGNVPSQAWKKEVIGEPWYLGDTYHLGIGQGYLLTTPLQVNFYTNVFANKGILYKPHLLKEEKEIINKDFIKKENIELVREGMKESCETGGVAWPFFDFKVKNEKLIIDNKDYTEEASGGAKFVRIKVGCKTGTAETTKNAEPHAWITVFAPFYNPEVTITVLAENSGEGSSVAGPIAQKILQAYFENK